MDVIVIQKLLEEYFNYFEAKSERSGNTDRFTDGLTSIINSIDEDFEHLTGISSDKKIFIRNLRKLITIVVSGKYNTIEKNLKSCKNSIRNNTKLMTRTKATVTRIPPVLLQDRIDNKNILNRRVRNIPFKIKKHLPNNESVEVEKNDRVVRKMRVG